MSVEFVIPIEALTAKAAFGMTFEAALIDGSRIVIAKLFMSLQFGDGKQLMLVGEDLLTPGTQITHDFVMGAFDVAVEVRPTVAGDIAAWIRAIVTQEQNCIVMYLSLLILDTKDFVRYLEIAVHKLFIALLHIVGEYNNLGFSLITLLVKGHCARGNERLPCNVHKLLSYTMLSIVEHRCGRSDGCMVQPQYEQPAKHR